MPKVGIFFFVAGKIIMDAVPVEQGESYGDAIQHGGHYEFWGKLVPKNIAERNLKSWAYDVYPRGRVVYFPKKKIFRIYHDACLKPEKQIQKVILKFEIADVKTELMKDAHYKCEICNHAIHAYFFGDEE